MGVVKNNLDKFSTFIMFKNHVTSVSFALCQAIFQHYLHCYKIMDFSRARDLL